MDDILRSARALLADKTKYIERNIKKLSEKLNFQTERLKKVSSDVDKEFDPED
jgi:hypothetical protein